jgi:predicted peptidase
MSYTLKKAHVHESGKWTLYTLESKDRDELLKTSSTELDENYQRLNNTRKESRKNAKVTFKREIKAISEKTTGDLSF